MKREQAPFVDARPPADSQMPVTKLERVVEARLVVGHQEPEHERTGQRETPRELEVHPIQ